MSFVGDLEHLPIVDLIQLLHSTKKSGTLDLKSKRGQSQLVFNEGYIVSANHHNNSIRVGQVLVDMKAISPEQLEKTLQDQKNAGSKRRPLVATLIENGLINKETAFNGLEMLIEMTIVDVLSWTSGTFELEIDKLTVSDEYRYFPDTLKETLNLNTQSILMDALRIYDEKKRDGTLEQGTFTNDGLMEEASLVIEEQELDISASVLGLDDLENLDKKIPEVFSGVRNFDPAEELRQKLNEALKDIPAGEQQKLISYLLNLSAAKETDLSRASDLIVIIYSSDRIITHLLSAACRADGLAVFTIDTAADLNPVLDQTRASKASSVIVVDSCEQEEGSGYLVNQIPGDNGIPVIKLVPGGDIASSLDALKDGVRTIFPKPWSNKPSAGFSESCISFTESFRAYLRKNSFSSAGSIPFNAFNRCVQELGTAQEIPDLSFALLKFISEIFERSVTFIVGNGELIAERSIGIKSDRNAGASAPLRFKLSLDPPSVFQSAIDDLRIVFQNGDDQTLKCLYIEIGPPAEPRVILVPIISFGRVVALTYADFGVGGTAPVPTDMIASLAKYAGVIFDNMLMRKKLEKLNL